jgi:hypothetical protein
MKYFIFFAPEVNKIYWHTLFTIDTKKISLEEALLEDYPIIFKSSKSKEKALRLIVSLYYHFRKNFKIKDYPPKNIKNYKKFKEFIKKAKKDISKKRKISKDTIKVIDDLLKLSRGKVKDK